MVDARDVSSKYTTTSRNVCASTLVETSSGFDNAEWWSNTQSQRFSFKSLSSSSVSPNLDFLSNSETRGEVAARLRELSDIELGRVVSTVNVCTDLAQSFLAATFVQNLSPALLNIIPHASFHTSPYQEANGPPDKSTTTSLSTACHDGRWAQLHKAVDQGEVTLLFP
jgi:hypothetical protein